MCSTMCSTPQCQYFPLSNSLPPDTRKTIDNFFSPNLTFFLKAMHFGFFFITNLIDDYWVVRWKSLSKLILDNIQKVSI